MITIITGKMVRIECGYEKSYEFYRDAEKLGLVILKKTSPYGNEPSCIYLPADPKEAQSIMDAYMRIVREDIAYRERETTQ
jgi:catechol 2,3-dioxygenase-like lactoylglutathione lyase family enzyme